MVEEHFSGDISAHPVITHPNSVVALSPCGRDVAIPYCREEAQRDYISFPESGSIFLSQKEIYIIFTVELCVCVLLALWP